MIDLSFEIEVFPEDLVYFAVSIFSLKVIVVRLEKVEGLEVTCLATAQHVHGIFPLQMSQLVCTAYSLGPEDRLRDASVLNAKAHVLLFVPVSVALLCEAQAAPLAVEGSLACMHALMVPDVAELAELCRADWTSEHLVEPACVFVVLPELQRRYFTPA